MDSFVANADKQLMEMFRSVQDEERTEEELHKQVVGVLIWTFMNFPVYF